nr:hypothetical protein GCM10025699_04020 [Microbacterium flavescens]
MVPFAARGAERDVLRSAVGPEIDLSAAVSPLAEYRALFTEERAQDVLFTVTSDSSLPERVRLATLDAYDGEVFRSGGEGSVDAGRFVRVPSSLDAGDGTPIEATIEIEALDGIWMPTVGRLSGVEFEGGRAAALADRFYYNAAASAGVQTAGGGLAPGDRYVASGVEPETPVLSEIEAPGGAGSGIAAPDSLRAWVEAHLSGSGGAALAELVGLLRERGYLSHGLDDGGDEGPAWADALADYRFQPSASGHSLARVDAMFGRLLEREDDPRAKASGNYVAAVGDDEQFAVAVALIARELGFPSRVVLGARLGETQPGLTSCDEGVCQAQDLSAWTEVQSADGDWVSVDVTPQWDESPSLDVTEQRDPEIVTEVRPDTVEEVLPPDPLQEDSATSDPAVEETGLDLAWLWPILRTTGVALLILGLALGPFLVVIGAKAARRRGRRRALSPATRIAGGWEEYVDAAIDAGREAPRTHTRRELALGFGSGAGLRLADTADRAVFSSGDATETDAAEYWRWVDDERRLLATERGFWRRLAVTVSLRSFVRHLAPPTGARTRFAERGGAGQSSPCDRCHECRCIRHRRRDPDLAARGRRRLRLDGARALRRVPQVGRGVVEGVGSGPQRHRAAAARGSVALARTAGARSRARRGRAVGVHRDRLLSGQRRLRIRRRHDRARRAAVPGVGDGARLRLRPLGGCRPRRGRAPLHRRVRSPCPGLHARRRRTAPAAARHRERGRAPRLGSRADGCDAPGAPRAAGSCFRRASCRRCPGRSGRCRRADLLRAGDRCVAARAPAAFDYTEPSHPNIPPRPADPSPVLGEESAPAPATSARANQNWGGFDLGAVVELTGEVTAAVSGAPHPIAAVPGVAADQPDEDSDPRPAVTRVPAARPAPTVEPWAPARSPLPEGDAFPEASGEVSAVAGAPDAGTPRSARTSVSAQHVLPEIPDDVDETVIANRRKGKWSLQLPTGSSVDLDADVVLVGRRPARSTAFPDAQLVVVDDGTVSKTHLRLERNGDEWSVTDLHSTNGTILIASDGAEREIPPGAAHRAPARLLLGDAELRLLADDTSR